MREEEIQRGKKQDKNKVTKIKKGTAEELKVSKLGFEGQDRGRQKKEKVR